MKDNGLNELLCFVDVMLTGNEVYEEENKLMVEASESTATIPMFTRAKGVKIFNVDGFCYEDYKGVVNQENDQQIFSVVGAGYKIIQHDDVYKAVVDAAISTDLSHDIKHLLMNEGARLHVKVRFPNVQVDIEDPVTQKIEKASLRITFDNSYNCTTGVRMEVSAVTGNGYWIVVGDKLGNFYHKHTKNYEEVNLKEELDKGITAFSNKIGEIFNKMAKKAMTSDAAIALIGEWIEKKVIAKTYLDEIEMTIKSRKLDQVQFPQISNVWNFYCLCCEVIQEKSKSMDAAKNHMQTIFGLLQ